MVEIFDLSVRKTAVLQNAFAVKETNTLNDIDTLEFSLPAADEKNRFCVPFHFVRYNGGRLYRIVEKTETRQENTTAVYQCEHVFATLLDDVLFGAMTYGGTNINTRKVLEYLLAKQTVKRWALKDCDFSYQYEYGWENENLLSAVLSVANLFTEPYIFKFNTDVYPWELSLKKINQNEHPQFYVRAGRNLLSSKHGSDNAEICTRLYCLGYGEGINQLTIKKVNGGKAYLDAPKEDVEKYGVVSRIFVDRSIENEKTLLERGKVMLEQYRKPLLTATVTAADLYNATKTEIDRAEVGKITRLVEDGTTTYITQVSRNYDTPGNMTLTLATKPRDIANSIAEMADRQRIETTYAQGSTQLYAQSVQANATPSIGAVLNFYIPSEMRIVNAVKAKITLDRFRSYSKSTSGGGGTTSASESGGGTTVETTSSTKAAESVTSTASTEYQDSGVYAVTGVPQWDEDQPGVYTGNLIETSVGHNHALNVNQLGHTHAVMYRHRHTITIPSHSHTVEISVPSHKHDVTIPAHTHGIEQGIFQFGSATGATVKVNGTERGTMEKEKELDITDYLVDASSGTIPRGKWMKLEIIPNDLAYVTIDILLQGFIQSRGESTL